MVYKQKFVCVEYTVNMVVETKLSDRIIGPSGVRALPVGVAAKRSVHYFCDYFSVKTHCFV